MEKWVGHILNDSYLLEVALATLGIACLAALSALVFTATKDASTLLLVRKGLRRLAGSRLRGWEGKRTRLSDGQSACPSEEESLE